mmetsp:Transcript_16092/g.52409  ORF Transcript_16092/g.52409 Transcript_16092/m.52409 type:complete len:302 (+) Transcript_16092:59-964(+)
MSSVRADAAALETIAAAIDRLCDCNRDLRATSPTSFDSVEAPVMTVHAYLVRIRRYTRFDDMCFLVALAYLGRLSEMAGPSFCLTYNNVHRLFITALVLASKSADDIFHANHFMAQCGGISLLELNALEIEMCKWLTFRLVLEPEDLRDLISAISDCASPYWASWLNVPHVPNVTPRPISCTNHGLTYASPAAAAVRNCAAVTKPRYDSVSMTIGDMAALLWPAAVLRPAAAAPGSPVVQPSSAKEIRPQPESPRNISTAFTKEEQPHVHVQAHAHREMHMQQMMQQPGHRWGLVSCMEVR